MVKQPYFLDGENVSDLGKTSSQPQIPEDQP